MSESAQIKKELKFVIRTFDGDMYILTGYKSAEEIDAAIGALEKARMPNGDIIKTSSISKIQAYDSYKFQSVQKAKHKRGQYIDNDAEWCDDQGGLGITANLKSITGKIEAPQLQSPQKRLAATEE